MVDDVDAGVERHVDGLAVGDVAAHQRAALVRRLDPAVISSGVISVCSPGATVPWPPVTNILMISAPSLTSSRTARRNRWGRRNG